MAPKQHDRRDRQPPHSPLADPRHRPLLDLLDTIERLIATTPPLRPRQPDRRRTASKNLAVSTATARSLRYQLHRLTTTIRKFLRHSSFEGDGHQRVLDGGAAARACAPRRAPRMRSHLAPARANTLRLPHGLARAHFTVLLQTDSHEPNPVTANPPERRSRS